MASCGISDLSDLSDWPIEPSGRSGPSRRGGSDREAGEMERSGPASRAVSLLPRSPVLPFSGSPILRSHRPVFGVHAERCSWSQGLRPRPAHASVPEFGLHISPVALPPRLPVHPVPRGFCEVEPARAPADRPGGSIRPDHVAKESPKPARRERGVWMRGPCPARPGAPTHSPAVMRSRI